jgi:hypothetical protein
LPSFEGFAAPNRFDRRFGGIGENGLQTLPFEVSKLLMGVAENAGETATFKFLVDVLRGAPLQSRVTVDARTTISS